MDTCSTLATNLDQYSLFGSAAQQNSNMVNSFSNMNISDDKMSFTTNFNDIGEHGKVQNDSFDLRNEFDCYDGDGKDSSEEMLNLESICGDTLAEKLANAENDIRNKDEILMRGIQEQQAMRSKFRMLDKAEMVDNKPEFESSEDAEYESRLASGEEFAEEPVQEAGPHFSTQPDCLTENSVDFMTAENSTSDAESSVEFGDAENSFEFEMDEFPCDREEIKSEISASHDSNANLTPSECDECGEILSENVPKSDVKTECNNGIAEATASSATGAENTHLLVNGDATQPEKVSTCGE